MHVVEAVAPGVFPTAGGAPVVRANVAPDAADTLDEAWAVLSDSLVVREQLNQACVEVKIAIDAIKMRRPAATSSCAGADECRSQLSRRPRWRTPTRRHWWQ